MKSKNVFVLITILIILFFVWVLRDNEKKLSSEEASIWLNSRFEECRQKGKDQKLCLKNTAEESALKIELADSFSVISENESKPDIFSLCHEFLHYLGREKYARGGDISSALANGNPVCFSGYYHGVLEEYMIEKKFYPGGENFEKLSVEIKNICTGVSKQTKDYNECLHGLGHALMFAFENELPEALKYCDFLETQNDQGWCYSGAFMENSNSSTNTDHPSKYVDEKDPNFPCSILDKKYSGTCYVFQGFWFAKLNKYDWKKTGEECGQITKPYDLPCFNSIGQNLVGYTTDLSIVKEHCLDIPQADHRRACIEGAAGALVQRYNNGSEQKKRFCELLDEGAEVCL